MSIKFIVPPPIPPKEQKLLELRVRLDVLKREYQELLADRRPRSAGSTDNSFELERHLRLISATEQEITALQKEPSSDKQPVTPEPLAEIQEQEPAKKKTATDLMWEGVNLAGRQISQKRRDKGESELTRPQIAAFLKDNAVKNKLRYARHSVATIEKHLTGASRPGRKRKPDK